VAHRRGSARHSVLRHLAPAHDAAADDPRCAGASLSASDYLAGVRADTEHVRLTGTPQPTPWDPELGEVMAATGRVLYEENVTDALIGDLSGSGIVG